MDQSELSAITIEFIVKSACIGFWLQWQVPNVLDLCLDAVPYNPQTCLHTRNMWETICYTKTLAGW